MMTKNVFFLYIIFLFIPFATHANNLSIHNEFIKIVVNNKDAKGRFSLETTLGNPDNSHDDYQDLIYGKPIPWTSYTTLLIDNNPFIFGNPDNRLQRRTKTKFNYASLDEQYVSDNSIISSTSIKNFDVSQKIGFYRNPNTNINDSMFIEYHVTNTSADTHYFGLRIMLDTKLGQNDGAPFRMGRDQITHEIQLSQKDLYAYWQAFDSLSTPNIISQGLLTDPAQSLTMPDSIHLANWGTLVDQPWNANYQQDRSFIRKGENQKDTALALTYNSKAIQPNQTKIFKTVYGLGGIAISSGELSLGLTAPKTILKTQDSPILIIAYLLNTGGYDAYNVKASFQLPKNIEILKGNTQEIFPILQKGQQVQFPLLIKVKKIKSNNLPISFSVKSSTFNSNTINHVIDIIKPPKLSIKIPKKIIIPSNNTYITINPIIHNDTSIPIKDITIFLSGINPSSLPIFEYPAKMIKNLAPNTSKPLSWSINTSTLNLPFSFKLSANSAYAINSNQSVLLYKAISKSTTPLLFHSQSNPTPPYYLTLKLTNLSYKNNHNLIITYPKKSVKFIDHIASNQLNMPITHKKSKGEISFSATNLVNDFIYFNYYVKNERDLTFLLSEENTQPRNESLELIPPRNTIQTLDLTLLTNNDIVSANYQKE
tara:strand:+ start:16589 stop:18547 length:1959 start_codon:yes stop_codon:yes gene_type:complete